jgi:oligoendopeptidase F
MSVMRDELIVADCWDLTPLYPTLSKWKEKFRKWVPQTTPKWTTLSAYQQTLNKNAGQVRDLLAEYFAIDRSLNKLATYAHLLHDQEITENDGKTAYDQAESALVALREESSWIEPELLALPEDTIQSYLNAPELAPYRHYLETIFRLKPHTLPGESEKLLAMAQKALASPHKTFRVLTDAEFKFPEVADSCGAKWELSHGKYGLYLRSPDRPLRESTFKTYHKHYGQFVHTLAQLIVGQLEAHAFQAKARHFSSSLEASLFPKSVGVEVYHQLIKTVREEIDALHAYIDLRKDILKLDKLHLYDLQAPLAKAYNQEVPFEQAAEWILESCSPLGEEYQTTLRKGLFEERWIDRYENNNKRSGAYSSGCYDSAPYVLMNYNGTLRDVFTLAHELGHSMHSYLTRKSQPYHYGDYSIFVAEVASTFNEELLLRFLLKNAKNEEQKKALIVQKIEDIRGNLFRQTLFAEFEWWLHTLVENGEPLNPEKMGEMYFNLNQFYYGPSMVYDEEVKVEWARIPHFYYNFYVFKYATGISAALALAERVVQGGKAEREAYLDFLKAGSHLYPIEALKLAGVDMSSPQPIRSTIQGFRELLQKLKQFST